MVEGKLCESSSISSPSLCPPILGNSTQQRPPQQILSNTPSQPFHPPWYHQMIAGATAGGIAAIFVSPLDVARVRVQVSRTAAVDNGLFGASLIRQMIREEGVKSLYRGLSANMLALVPNWMTYFIAYSQFRGYTQPVLEPIIGSPLFDITSAVVAGATCTLFTHPLWLVKARMQVQGLKEKHPKSITTPNANAVVSDSRLYRASQAAVANVSPSHSTLPLNPSQHTSQQGSSKTKINNKHISGQASRPNNITSQTSPSPANPPTHSNSLPNSTNSTRASAIESVAATTSKSNIGVVSHVSHEVYQGPIHALKQIVRTEGWRALYHGLVPQLFGLAHAAIHFPLYEACKRQMRAYNCKTRLEHKNECNLNTRFQTSSDQTNEDIIRNVRKDNSGTNKATSKDKQYSSSCHSGDLTTLQIVLASTISKVLACAIAYPHEVLRSRFQTQDYLHSNTPGFVRYTSVADAVSRILKEEGVRGLYRGIGITLFRSVPACIVTFVVYEEILKKLRNLSENRSKKPTSTL